MSDVPFDCPDCGQVHPRGCRAHSGRGTRPCGLRPVTGLQVCQVHGGRSPQAKAKSAAVKAEAKAAREVARLGHRVVVHPAEALIDLVHWTAGEVAYWRNVVTQIADEQGDDGQPAGYRALTWGVTKVKEGGDDRGTTTAAGPHIAYTMLTSASDRLASYAAAALRAGVDERRVQLAERQGQLVADVIRGVLDALNLTPEQWELVPTIVPAQLRLLTATKETLR